MRTVILIIIAVALMMWAIGQGIKSHEKMECDQWQEEAIIYEGYYITGWQYAQCKHYGIFIDAPVY